MVTASPILECLHGATQQREEQLRAPHPSTSHEVHQMQITDPFKDSQPKSSSKSVPQPRAHRVRQVLPISIVPKS